MLRKMMIILYFLSLEIKKKNIEAQVAFKAKKNILKIKKKYWIPSKIYSSRFGVISRANF